MAKLMVSPQIKERHIILQRRKYIGGTVLNGSPLEKSKSSG